MQAIQDFFTKLKAWQIFLLLIGLMIIGQVVFTLQIAELANNKMTQEEAMAAFHRVVWIFGFFMVGFSALFFGWFWSCGLAANRSVPEAQRMSAKWFQAAVTYALLYVPFYMIMFMLPNEDGTAGNLQLMAILFPLHLFAMFCMFYLMYFFATNLARAQNNGQPDASATVGYFFGLWFYPIGIWFIQPKINRLVAKDDISVTPQSTLR